MSALLFVSQAMLDAWAEQGKIELDGPKMALRSHEGVGRSFALEPALRFLQVVGAETDPHALVGKVKPEARLRELGGERLGESVVLGDVAYEVQTGFLAEASAPPAGASAGSAAAERKNTEALARFLLENLS
jgi:hypothetical protein